MDASPASANASASRAEDTCPGDATLEAGHPATPADRLTAAYNVALALVWGALLTRTAYAPWLCAAHAAGAAVPWLFTRASANRCVRIRPLRDIYPLIWLLAFWIELDFLRHLLHAGSNDGPIAAFERMVLGANIDSVWMPSMPATWFSELMHLLYFSYYPAVVLPLVYMAVAGSSVMQRDVTFRVMLVYLASFAVYIVCPVDGPHFLGPRYEGPLTEGFFYRLVSALQGAGDSQGCSFPSSHVAASVAMAYLGIRWFPRWVAALLVAAAAGVAVSSVYTQNHYAIDALAGVIWALSLQLLLAPVLLRRWGGARSPAAQGLAGR